MVDDIVFNDPGELKDWLNSELKVGEEDACSAAQFLFSRNFTKRSRLFGIRRETLEAGIDHAFALKLFNKLNPEQYALLSSQSPPKQSGQKRPPGALLLEPPVKKPTKESKFTVYLLDQHKQVVATCDFSGNVPTTISSFWEAVLVKDGINITINKSAAYVSVRLKERWSKLDTTPHSPENYHVDGNSGFSFQISPFSTPYSSPSNDDKLQKERTRSDFKSLISKLFPANPFGNAIPATFRDKATQSLRSFLQSNLDTRAAVADSDVLALVLAMPGSGKTRTVVEAARQHRYHRFKMSTHDLSGVDSVRQFLRDAVLKACGGNENAIPMKHEEVVVFHFDDIQGLMQTQPGAEESLVNTFAREIDDLVNPKGESARRTWLKFVLSGTNVFTQSAIKIATGVKARPISLDGAFSLDFVTKLANDHGLGHLLQGTDYLERCRHNRRFTQWFFESLWYELIDEESSVERAYSDAFYRMKEQMSNQYSGRGGTTVSQVACSVFAKILMIPDSQIREGRVSLGECSELEREYIAGGGLSVYAMDQVETEDRMNLTIYQPTGVVLELLEAFLAPSPAPETGRTVMSFLRVNKVCNFRGHLFEWLIAYDISCARSNIDDNMRLDSVGRKKSCIGGKVKSHPQVYATIVAENNPSIWVVPDTQNSYEDRWVDVAYPIEVTDEVTDRYQEYEKGLAFMECKSGYGRPTQREALKRFRDKFFARAAAFAESRPEIFFVATFVSQHLKQQARPASAPPNLKTIVLAVTAENCPWISHFLALDITDEEKNE